MPRTAAAPGGSGGTDDGAPASSFFEQATIEVSIIPAATAATARAWFRKLDMARTLAERAHPRDCRRDSGQSLRAAGAVCDCRFFR